MKIAIFTDTFYPNIDGVVTSLLNSTDYLAKKGHKILVIAPKYNDEGDHKFHKNIQIERMPSVPMPNYKEFRYVFPCSGKCKKIIDDFKPDLIHVETYSTIGWTGARIANKLNLPLIGTYHTIAAEFVKYLSPISLLGVDKLIEKFFPPKSTTTLPSKKDNVLKKSIWKETIMLYNKCDIVTTPSPAIKDELKKRGLKKEIIPISNGIRTELYPLKKKISTKPRNIVHVGRLSYEKKVDVLLYAFKEVLTKIPDAQFTIVGSGPAIGSLKKLSDELGISKNVLFTGFISQKEKVGHLQKSDIFLTASPMETQGLVLLEAMSCGLPAIGVDRYAIPNVIHHGKNGYIAREDYVKNIAKYIIKLMDSKVLLKQLSKVAVKESKKHQIENCILQMEDTYKRLISK